MVERNGLKEIGQFFPRWLERSTEAAARKGLFAVGVPVTPISLIDHVRCWSVPGALSVVGLVCECVMSQRMLSVYT